MPVNTHDTKQEKKSDDLIIVGKTQIAESDPISCVFLFDLRFENKTKNVYFQKLLLFGILAICGTAIGDVSHLLPGANDINGLPSANDINGLSGYQYEPKENSLLYLPPLQPQQQPKEFQVNRRSSKYYNSQTFIQ